MTVTILVPVFCVEKYIAECAESLFSQTYSDIEYVFCDDCTPDRSIEVLCEVMERYAERKEHVRIIRNEPNRGIGATRSRLVSEVSTDCFMFVDSDDILPRNAVEILVNRMKLKDTDIVDGGYALLENGKCGATIKPSHDSPSRYLDKILCQNIILPRLWGRLYKASVLSKVKDIFIDGIREEPFCEIDKNTGNYAGEWNVRIGVDFVSGGSNTVHIHVQQCLDYVRDQLGYAIKKGDKVVFVPPKKILDKIKESEIPDAIDVDLQQTLLKAHEDVNLTGKCPGDIEAYIILMNVYEQVKNQKMDYVVINDQLNKQRNGTGRVQSCAFSREWNKRYQESASFECDIDKDRCLYRQENDGNTEWQINYENDRFEYINKKFLFFNLNPKSIHKGGTMLDLRLLRLSTNLFLEAYLNLKGEPVTLGLIIVPRDKTIEDYEDEEDEEDSVDQGGDDTEETEEIRPFD